MSKEGVVARQVMLGVVQTAMGLPLHHAIALPGGGQLEFILTVPGRRHGDFVDLLEPFHSAQCASAKQEVLGEVTWNKLRLIMAHDLQVALDAGAKRDSCILELEK